MARTYQKDISRHVTQLQGQKIILQRYKLELELPDVSLCHPANRWARTYFGYGYVSRYSLIFQHLAAQLSSPGNK